MEQVISAWGPPYKAPNLSFITKPSKQDMISVKLCITASFWMSLLCTTQNIHWMIEIFANNNHTKIIRSHLYSINNLVFWGSVLVLLQYNTHKNTLFLWIKKNKNRKYLYRYNIRILRINLYESFWNKTSSGREGCTSGFDLVRTKWVECNWI